MGLRLKVYILFLFAALSLMSLAVYAKQKNMENRELNVQGIADYSNYPVIQNIAPNTAVVGFEYRYELGVIDSDTHPANIRINMVEGPSWLSVEGLVLLGTPSLSDLGSTKVEIEISDGEHSTFKTFYILVTPPDETE